MIRTNALDFIKALAILLCVLSLIGAIEERDEIAQANRSQEVRAERAALADKALGVVRLAAK